MDEGNYDMGLDEAYETVFLYEASVLGVFKENNDKNAINRKFCSWFGANAFICSKIWQHILLLGPLQRGCVPKHLLWSLMYMKSYSHEHVISLIVKADEKTVRKWKWYIIDLVAKISDKVVSLIKYIIIHLIVE